jgi:hypothetical protein
VEAPGFTDCRESTGTKQKNKNKLEQNKSPRLSAEALAAAAAVGWPARFSTKNKIKIK